MSYLNEVFYPPSLEAAKDTVLSPDATNPHKFEQETRFLIEFIAAQKLIEAGARVLDFGCGMGRVSKALLGTGDCTVDGTDPSAAMRRFAKEYVASERFAVFEQPPEGGAYDLALAVFVLQHVQFPDIEVEKLYEALRPGGTLLVVDEGKRLVPVGIDAEGFARWEDDGVKVEALLAERFEPVGRYAYCNRVEEKPLTLWRKH